METFDTIDEMFAEIDEWCRKHPWKTKWYRLLHILSWREIKYRLKLRTVWRWHRGKHGWAKNDTWSFDSYLAKVIIGGVTHLKENTHGYPIDLTEEKWDRELQIIIDGFQAYLECDLLTGDALDDKMLVFRKGMRTFSKRFGNLWD